MPYLDNYLKRFENTEHEIQFLIWDRFLTEDFNPKYIFRRGSKQHKRNVLDYYIFGKFITKHLKDNVYNRIICFGLQTAFFIKSILYKKYSKKFILDVRDYNSIIRFYNFKKLISSSNFTVISSSGYTTWLPKQGNYFINHNFNFSDLSEIKYMSKPEEENIRISSIGALRDLEINLNLISTLGNNSNFTLSFNGYGDISTNLENKSSIYNNIEFTGFYKKDIELEFYKKSNLINVLRYPDNINNITALPNRLYLAPYYGRPLLAFKGTYMAEIINEFNLGLVVNSFDNLSGVILNYINNFDVKLFDSSRNFFLNKVINDNNIFNQNIDSFLLDF